MFIYTIFFLLEKYCEQNANAYDTCTCMCDLVSHPVRYCNLDPVNGRGQGIHSVWLLTPGTAQLTLPPFKNKILQQQI